MAPATASLTDTCWRSKCLISYSNWPRFVGRTSSENDDSAL